MGASESGFLDDKQHQQLKLSYIKENMKKLSLPIYSILIFLLLLSCSKQEENEELFILPQPTITFNSATLYWFSVFPPTDRLQVLIFLDDILVAEVEDELSYKLTNLDQNTSYSGRIVANDLVNNKSYTVLFSFTTLTNKPPEPFTININTIKSNSCKITWNLPIDPDADTLMFDLVLNDIIIGENHTDNSYTLNGLSPEKTYFLDVIAKDNYGNEITESTNFRTLIEGAEVSYRNGNFEGQKREYGIYIPSNTSGKIPLVINLHGHGGIVWPQMITNYYPKLAEREKFIILMPQGDLNEDGKPRWDTENTNDLVFIDHLIDIMIEKYNVDAERIYLTGMSNGAFMTYFLTKKLEDRLAAIGPIAGTMGQSKYYSYSLNKPMPLCHIHGTADSTVQSQGNATHVSVEKILEFWMPHNNVDSQPIITELPNTNINDNSSVTKFEYTTLNNSSADIVYYRINNGSHSVPGIQSVANRDINAYDELWEFFKTRRLSDK